MAGVDKNMPILIVDEYRTMLGLIRRLLHRLGFDSVEEARDGGSALEKLRARDFGLVISDWNMEPMNGLRLLEEVRKDAKLKDLPFLMVATEGESEAVIAARHAGLSNYIVKPFDAGALKAKLAAVLGSF